LILSLAVFPGWLQPLLVVALFVTLELVIANLVEPLLYGAHTGISPLAILVTTVFWTILWGPAGLILSTPLTVCAGVLGRYFPQLRFLHILLGDEPALEPAALLYQRLLALDQPEAHEVADVFLKDHPLVSLYDTVFIPALGMAERDRHEGSLDHEREEFLFLNCSEMIAEFADARPEPAVAATEDVVAPLRPNIVIQPKPPLPGRVFCLPASDEADSITALMLVQLLEQAGHRAVALPVAGSLRALQAQRPAADDLICICALPPFALARSKALSKETRSRFANVTTLVGIWGFNGEANKAQPAEPGQSNKILTTLAEAVDRISEIKTGTNQSELPLKPEPGQEVRDSRPELEADASKDDRPSLVTT
jgi:AI-2E family transporter